MEAEVTKAFDGFRVGEVMGDVREPGAARIEFADERKSLVHGLVHRMRRVAEGVEDELVKIGEEGERGVRNGAEVGDISGTSEAEAENFHVAVNQRNRRDFDAEKIEGRGCFAEGDAGNRAELGFAVEDVGEGALNGAEGFRVSENGKRNLLAEVVWADVVKTHDVVGVPVGEEKGIEAIELGAEGLLTEIGRRINDGELVVAREQQGRTKALVVRILRTANAAMAAERRNAHGRAGAENRDF